MGKLIQFAGTRKYKITLIVFISLSIIFLLMGVIFSISFGTTQASSIQIFASGSTTMGTRHIIPASIRHTPVTIQTTPAGALVNLEIIQGHDLVSIPQTSIGGREVIIELLNNNITGVPTFHNPADPSTHVEILVTGQAGVSAVLDIQITLQQSQVVMTTSLQRRNTPLSPWHNVDSVDFVDFRTWHGLNMNQNLNQPMYRVVTTFDIPTFNESTQPLLTTETPAGAAHFSASEQTLHHQAGIQLFQPTPLNHMTMLHIPEGSWIEDFPFAISVNFQGRIFPYFFTLRIV